MTNLDALKEDMKRMDAIAEDCGMRAATVPYVGNSKMTDRYFWAVAVTLLHVVQWILRREKNDQDNR